MELRPERLKLRATGLEDAFQVGLISWRVSRHKSGEANRQGTSVKTGPQLLCEQVTGISCFLPEVRTRSDDIFGVLHQILAGLAQWQCRELVPLQRVFDSLGQLQETLSYDPSGVCWVARVT